jgi:hypothetical protein
MMASSADRTQRSAPEDSALLVLVLVERLQGVLERVVRYASALASRLGVGESIVDAKVDASVEILRNPRIAA